jgi:hypothetical protein
MEILQKREKKITPAVLQRFWVIKPVDLYKTIFSLTQRTGNER